MLAQSPWWQCSSGAAETLVGGGQSPCRTRKGRAEASTLTRAARFLALLLFFTGVPMGGLGHDAVPVAAQAYPVLTPTFPGAFEAGGGCGGLGDGTFTCYFDSRAVAGDPSDPGTITIAAAFDPADLILVSGYAADRAGHVCHVTAGAGTQTLTLGCPGGLQAYATGSVTFRPEPGNVTVTYSSPQAPEAGGVGPAMQRLFFSRWPSGPQAGPEAIAASTYPAGWNLVGGPSGWNLNNGPGSSSLPGPFYTYQESNSDYQSIPANVPLLAGLGVWAYFPSPTSVLGTPGSFLLYVTVPLPARHWIMIGNPSLGPAKVSGADAVYTYNPNIGSYEHNTSLQPGQGAWAWSANGGTVTVSSACPSQTC